MKIIKSINQLNKEVNFKANIGFVPTMGALHNGHLSLIESSKKKCKKTIVSIFINPSQFDKKSDFNKYPREEATIPLPKPERTPPKTNIYFVLLLLIIYNI